jgi:hypothetical protein
VIFFGTQPPDELKAAAATGPIPLVWGFPRARRARPLPAAFVLMYHSDRHIELDRSFLRKSLERRCYPKRLADLIASREEEQRRLKEELEKQLELEREEALRAEEKAEAEAAKRAAEAAKAAEAAEAAEAHEAAMYVAPFGEHQMAIQRAGAFPITSASEIATATCFPVPRLPQAFVTGLVHGAPPPLCVVFYTKDAN